MAGSKCICDRTFLLVVGSYLFPLPYLLRIPILPLPRLTGACALPLTRAVFSPAHAPGGRVVDYQFAPGSLEKKRGTLILWKTPSHSMDHAQSVVCREVHCRLAGPLYSLSVEREVKLSARGK